MTYSDKLKDPKWQKKRLQILNRDKFTCKKCKDTKTTLHVHHLEYNGNPWETENKFLVTLCEHCHETIENLKNDVDYVDINIYKSNHWQNEEYIIFASYPGICDMRIYNKNNDYISGFNIPYSESLNIIKALRKSKDQINGNL